MIKTKTMRLKKKLICINILMYEGVFSCFPAVTKLYFNKIEHVKKPVAFKKLHKNKYNGI